MADTAAALQIGSNVVLPTANATVLKDAVPGRDGGPRHRHLAHTADELVRAVSADTENSKSEVTRI